MKIKSLFLIAIIAIITSQISFAQSEEKNTPLTTTTFGVRGNCEMCKSTIEKAAKNIPGVKAADWNIEQKYIDVSFDASTTNQKVIEAAISKSGYDTQNTIADQVAYDDLPGCCQYDRDMKMGRTTKVKSDKKSCCSSKKSGKKNSCGMSKTK